MDVRELRIGNYILGEIDENEFAEVEVVALDSVDLTEHHIWCTGLTKQADEYYSFKPISLTEEWLIRFGFDKHTTDSGFGLDVWNWYSKEDIEIHTDRADGTFVNPQYIASVRNVKLESVHQLQNLYHALTGEELTIKD